MENQTKSYLSQSLIQTKTVITKLFDTIDNIDRKLFYGRQMKVLIWSCLSVLVIAPLLDKLLGVQDNLLTFYATLLFAIFLVLLVLSFVSSWRDDMGNWTILRTKSRLQTFYDTIKDTIALTRTNSQDENLFFAGHILLLGGIIWKSLQNISIFIRKPLEGILSTKFTSLREFENFTNYYWIPILIGLGIIIYLYKTNRKISERIKKELKQLFDWESERPNKCRNEIVKVEMLPSHALVINLKTEHQIDSIKSASNSKVFIDFATALQNWNPRKADYEYQYQDRLYRHLRKYLPDASIELEYPIKDQSSGNKSRADIVVNNTILIEIKRNSSAAAIQRAKGQLHQYSEMWNNKGPVVLLLLDYDYEHAKFSFSPIMQDLTKLNRSVITIVAKTK